MIKFSHVSDVMSAIRHGKEAADLLTTRFKAPIRLEFEKIFFPFLLISYVGVSVEMELYGFDVLNKFRKTHGAFHPVAFPASRYDIAKLIATR